MITLFLLIATLFIGAAIICDLKDLTSPSKEIEN